MTMIKNVEQEEAAPPEDDWYRTLFSAMDQGFCIIEKVHTVAGEPSDYRYIAANPAFERHTGLRDPIGKTILQLVPSAELSIMDRYDRVVRTGKPERFEDFVSALNLWIEAEAFPTRKPSQIAVLFSNVTTRKDAEAALQENAKRQAFLLTLSDALRPLSDPAEIKGAASRLLGEELAVNRVFYADADRDRWLVAMGYERGIPPLPEMPFLMADYGPWIIDDFHAGRRLVVHEVHTDARFQASERAALEALQIGGAAAVPLVKSGMLVATLALHTVAPREWTEWELSLIEETAERTWASVERARAESAMRESEMKLAVELADTKQLQRISSSLIEEGDVNALYRQVLDVARALMHSDMASIQIRPPERSELFLLAHHGFAPESAKFWE
jgi:GAF domain-containing protein